MLFHVAVDHTAESCPLVNNSPVNCRSRKVIACFFGGNFRGGFNWELL